MELHEYLLIIKKRIWLIIIITLVFIISSGLYTHFMIKPSYAANINIIVEEDKTGKAYRQINASTYYSNVLLYENLVKTYAELAKSRTVADTVIRNLNLSMSPSSIPPMISTSPRQDTQFLGITVHSGDPKLAMDIANETARVLKAKSIDLGMGDNINILDEALLPRAPYSPNLRLNIAIAGFLGIFVSLGLIFLLEYLDNTVKSQEEAERITSIPVIGIIPLIEKD